MTIDKSHLPALLAALQYRQRVLCAEIQSAPFSMARYAERDRNWAAIMALRDAVGDYSPAPNREPAT